MAARQNVEVLRLHVKEKTQRPEALSFWLAHVLEPGSTVMDDQAEVVTLSTADSPAQACELAAGVIQRLTGDGARWREIAVAYTDERYVRAVKTMLQRAGIGANFAGTDDLLPRPPLQPTLSAMHAASRVS